MIRGVAGYLYYFAFDTTTGLGLAGDSANHTLRLQKDGGASAAPANAPATVDATYAPGWYKVLLTTAEATANDLFLCGISSTANVKIDPVQVSTQGGAAVTVGSFSAGALADAAIADGMLRRTISTFGGAQAVRQVDGVEQYYELDSSLSHTDTPVTVAGVETVTRT